MRPPRLHLPRPGRRPRVPNVEQRPVSGEYAAPDEPACGAVPEGDDAPVAGVVEGCTLTGPHPYHRGDVVVGGRRYPSGWAWPRRG